MQSLKIFATEPHGCAYLPDREARTLYIDPYGPMDNAIYAQLLEQGYRRSGEFVYRPGCLGCQACESLRIPVDAFQARRRHRRCIRRNQDLQAAVTHPELGEEHVALYRRYIGNRHDNSTMQTDNPEKIRSFLLSHWSSTFFLEYRLGGQLICVAVVDQLLNGLSAVYTFFDPAHGDRGLGNLAILHQLSLAKERRLPHVYLGYWIEQCGPMAYKSGFRPHERFINGRWIGFS